MVEGADPVSATGVDTALSRRTLSLLRAVLTGHAELVCGRQPHLLVDGLHVCDMDTFALAGLIAPAIPGRAGMRVLAVLTDAGCCALEAVA